MEYGYCALCRDFHAAQADLDPTVWKPPPMLGGGFMRCCADSLRAWSIYHPAPWEPGTIVRCVFSEDPFLHAMKYCAGGHWHWNKAECVHAASEVSA